MLTFSNPIYKKIEPNKSLLKSAQQSPFGYSEPKLKTGLQLDTKETLQESKEDLFEELKKKSEELSLILSNLQRIGHK